MREQCIRMGETRAEYLMQKQIIVFLSYIGLQNWKSRMFHRLNAIKRISNPHGMKKHEEKACKTAYSYNKEMLRRGWCPNVRKLLLFPPSHTFARKRLLRNAIQAVTMYAAIS